jgi:hypothetical protein
MKIETIEISSGLDLRGSCGNDLPGTHGTHPPQTEIECMYFSEMFAGIKS